MLAFVFSIRQDAPLFSACLPSPFTNQQWIQIRRNLFNVGSIFHPSNERKQERKTFSIFLGALWRRSLCFASSPIKSPGGGERSGEKVNILMSERIRLESDQRQSRRASRTNSIFATFPAFSSRAVDSPRCQGECPRIRKFMEGRR